MVYCSIVGCKNRSGLNSNCKLFKVPAVISNQGEEFKLLTEEKRNLWISRINRKDITFERYTAVCSIHFNKGNYLCFYLFIYEYLKWDYFSFVYFNINFNIWFLGAPSKWHEKTSADWAPSLNLGYDSNNAVRMFHLKQAWEDTNK